MRTRELRALWMKSWLETRWGFALSIAILMLFSIWSVERFPAAVRGGQHDMQVHHHANAALRGVRTYAHEEIFEKLAVLWAIFSAMLGTGGLLREKLLGTAPFLLSLPAGRRQLVAVRCAVTISQAACLALVSFAIVPLLFPLVGQSYPLGLALRYAALLFISGICYAIYGILISAVLEGSAWPAVIGASTVFLSVVLGAAIKDLRAYAPLSALSDAPYFRFGSIPWTSISIGLAMSCLMLAFALWIVKWQDF